MLIEKKILSPISIEIYNAAPQENFLSVKQVHGIDLVWDHQILASPKELLLADGILSRTLKNPLAIKTADCLPLFVKGGKGFAAIHAGHKGLSAGILHSPLIKEIEPICFYFGPSIRPCCYQVQEDFRAAFPNSNSFIQEKKRLIFDLRQEAIIQLQKSYPQCTIFSSPRCTSCDKQLNSFRRDKTAQRNFNILRNS